jgi:glucose-1-phosphate adenylyltransferase
LERVLAIIMAGGAGDRLQPLTRKRSKAAVPFGAKFRLIDITLSNCINSGVRKIYVLTQYLSESLHRHLQEGWSISSARLGDFIYTVPAQQKAGADWYRGTADAVRQNLDLVKGKDIDDILILSGDHVYKMDYTRLVNYHRKNNAGLTISAVRVRKNEATYKLGVLQANAESRLVGFEEKPAEPKTMIEAPDYSLASMGVYIFKAETLFQVLQNKEDDFGKHIIPGMIGKHDNIFVYDYEKENAIEDFVTEVRDGIRKKVLVSRTRDSNYWKDVGTIDAYYESSMDLVGIDPQFNLYGERWPLRTYLEASPPSKCILGGKFVDSIMSDGCIISGGTAWQSVLSPCVIIERGAVVEQSILFDNVTIEPGARIKRAIIDKDCRIRAGATIGINYELDKARGCTVSPGGITVVPKGANIVRNEPSFF